MIPLVTSQIGYMILLKGITEFAPSAAIPLHHHNCEESVIMLEGEAIAEIDGVRHRMGANDTTWVPDECVRVGITVDKLAAIPIDPEIP